MKPTSAISTGFIQRLQAAEALADCSAVPRVKCPVVLSAEALELEHVCLCDTQPPACLDGYFTCSEGGKYKIFAAHGGANATAKVEQFRRRFTIAHEIAHVLIHKHQDKCCEWLGRHPGELLAWEREQIAEATASALLMPRALLTDCVAQWRAQQPDLHPLGLLKRVANAFEVNLRAALLRLRLTGALLERPYLLAAFQFVRNPAKQSLPSAWRLKPGFLITPRGVSLPPTAYHSSSLGLFVDRPGYDNVGLNTLRLGTDRAAETLYIGAIEAMFIGTPIDGFRRGFEEPVWCDLNAPTTRKGVTPAHCLRLRRVPLQTEGCDVTPSLFSCPSIWQRANGPWNHDDRMWRLAAINPRCFGWETSQDVALMLLGAELRLFKRE